MGRKKQDFANRPNTPWIRWVTTADGRRVENRAYDPNFKAPGGKSKRGSVATLERKEALPESVRSSSEEDSDYQSLEYIGDTLENLADIDPEFSDGLADIPEDSVPLLKTIISDRVGLEGDVTPEQFENICREEVETFTTTEIDIDGLDSTIDNYHYEDNEDPYNQNTYWDQ